MTLKKMSVAANDIVLNNLVMREKTFKSVPQRRRRLLLSPHFPSWLCQPARGRPSLPPAPQGATPLRALASPWHVPPTLPVEFLCQASSIRRRQKLQAAGKSGCKQCESHRRQTGAGTRGSGWSRHTGLADLSGTPLGVHRVQSRSYAGAARLVPPHRPLSSDNWLRSRRTGNLALG